MGSSNVYLREVVVSIPSELNGFSGSSNTFTVDLLAHTTYSCIFDSSVATIDVEKGVVSDNKKSTQKEKATDCRAHTLR